MIALVTETLGGEPYQYVPLGEHVVRAMGVCGGRPTVLEALRIVFAEFERTLPALEPV